MSAISPLMNLFEEQDINTFEEAKQLLTNEPYNLKINVNEGKTLFCIFFNDKNTNKDNEIVKECNGIIIDYNNIKNIVCNGVLFSEEQTTVENLKTYIVKQIIDGTNIRLYSFNNKWYVSTRTMIDANKSHWNNKKSFAVLFNECCETFKFDYTKLSTDFTYSFIIQHSENRIIIDYKCNTLIHTLTYNQKTRMPITSIFGIPQQLFRSFDTVEEMKTALSQNETGFLLITSTKNIQIFSDKYLRLKELKGNTQNISRHLLNIIKNDDLDEYLEIFPEYKSDYAKLTKKINQFVNNMYFNYVDMKIKKQQINITKFEKEVMYLTHGEYIRNKTKVSRKLIHNVIMNLAVYKIYRLLR